MKDEQFYEKWKYRLRATTEAEWVRLCTEFKKDLIDMVLTIKTEGPEFEYKPEPGDKIITGREDIR